MAVRKKKVVRLHTKTATRQSRSKTVADMKRKYKDLPLHFLFGIREEIDYQCPILDDYLIDIKSAIESLQDIRKCRSLPEAQVKAALALHALSGLVAGIDEVTRNNFEKIRETAEDWKQLALAAIDETKEPEKFLKI